MTVTKKIPDRWRDFLASLSNYEVCRIDQMLFAARYEAIVAPLLRRKP
jgi:hypothetical protein